MTLAEEQANSRVRSRMVTARKGSLAFTPSEADRDKLRLMIQSKQVSKKAVCKLLGCDYRELKQLLNKNIN